MMKKIYITLCMSLAVFSTLAAQNIDINREKDKKEKSAEDLKELEVPNVGRTAPGNKTETLKTADIISLSDAEETITVIKTEKKERSRSRDSRASKKAEAPPARKFRVRLFIQNNNPHPMWYLMPYNGASKLPENGLFNAEPSLVSANKMIVMRVYEGLVAGTALREILFTGLPNQHFRAFYLPAGATLSLRNYNIDCWQDAETVEFWAVKELKANNSHALETVLPYKVLSSEHTEINCPKEQGCVSTLVEPENKLSTEDELIRFIKADKVSKYAVRLNQPQ